MRRSAAVAVAGLLVLAVTAVPVTTPAQAATGLTVDSSTPAMSISAYLGYSPASRASNSFSPPTGSVVVVSVFARDAYAPAGWTSKSVTDSLGTHLSWTLAMFQGDSATYTGAVGVWWAHVGSAPGPMTATVTLAVGGGQYINSIGVAVEVLTGASASNPVGAVTSGHSTGQSLSVSLTPGAAGSALFLGATDGNATETPTAGSGDHVVDAMNNNNTSAALEWVGTSSGPTLTTSTAARTLTMTGGTSAAAFDYIAYEVRPGAGAPPPPPPQICGSPTLHSPYSSSNHPALGTTTNVVTVSPGNVSALTLNTANTTYYFAPGSFNLNTTSVFNQIQMGDNDWYVGEYSGGVGATLTGQYFNDYAFTSTPGYSDTIEYMTVVGFIGAHAIGESVGIGAAADQTYEYNTVEYNYPGSGIQLGTNGVAKYNCVTSNGDYGIQTFSNTATSSLTTGPSNVTVENNEISYNDQCNYEAVPTGYFPITPPSRCGPVGYHGCGCAGGAHFWNVDGSFFRYNNVHDNYDVAAWWDTDNNGETVENNYFANNFGIAVDIETSYNALIENNAFVGNGWGAGACGAASGNPCYTNGNLAPTIYISESGGNSQAVGNAGGIVTISISGNSFIDNWDGVLLYQNSDRFCGSTANTSTGFCTLVPNAKAYWDQTGTPPSSSYYADDALVTSNGDAVTNGTTTVTSAGGFRDYAYSATEPAVGSYVSGPGIPIHDTVASVPATTTVASGSDNVDVSTFTGSQTLYVASTAGWPTANTIAVTASNGWPAAISCTGETATALTGCNSHGSTAGRLSTGARVVTSSKVTLTTAVSGSGTGQTIYTGAAGGCSFYNLQGASPTSAYYNNCLWKTQNVNVSGNTFSFNASAIPGCTSLSASPCGQNGIASQAPSGTLWSPYQTTASGNAVSDAITNCRGSNTFTGCSSQNNYFSNNTYTHAGSQNWQFYYLHLQNTIATSAWQGHGQDSGSTFG